MSAETKQKVQKLDELLTELLLFFPSMTMYETAEWPSSKELGRLDNSVHDLAMVITQRKTHFLPRSWKAYKVVDKTWPSIQLIKRLDRLVNRARERLQKAGISYLEWLRGEAPPPMSFGPPEDYDSIPEAKRFWKDWEAFGGTACKADGIEWERHEKVLFSRSDNKLVRPERGDSPDLRRLKCYARALELLVEDERYYQPLLAKAEPLLKWIATGDNSDYSDVLEWDCHSKWLSGFAKESLDDLVHSEKRHREMAQQRIRQGIHRLRSILTSRERMALAKVWYHKAPSQFRAKVSEADFVRKISR